MRHRNVDGFVILPAAFSDGHLSREAWRAVKECLGIIRASKRPSGLLVRAVIKQEEGWKVASPPNEIPIRATWVDVWRAIHRTRGVGMLRRFRQEGTASDLGVSVEAAGRPKG